MSNPLAKLEKFRSLLGAIHQHKIKPRKNSRLDIVARQLGVLTTKPKPKRKTKAVKDVNPKRKYK